MSGIDCVILNGRVLTMDPGQPRAEAIAISGDKIAAIGTNAEIAELAPPQARRIDAQGATVMPGMTEAHLHLFAGAFGMRLLQLLDVAHPEGLRAPLRAYADSNPDEALLICKQADYNLFSNPDRTPREVLDAALSERPVIVIAGDHHTAWANTIALKRAGILQGLNTPVGSEVVMSKDGTANGELREHGAFDPVMALRSSGGREGLGLGGVEPDDRLTDADRAQDLEVMRDGLNLCASYGFTSLHNMDGNRYQLELLQELERDGALLCRTDIPLHMTPSKDISALEQAVDWRDTFASDYLSSKRIKVFMDGVIDSSTAVLVDDYADTPGWRGDLLHTPERFRDIAIEADRRGFQIAVHAIGDGAIRRTLDGYAAAREANGARDSRHRIEHVELLHPDDLPRFKELGVVASMQPSHPPGAMDFPLEPWVSRVGEARWPWAFPLAALRAQGTPIAFASDWPVADLNPMRSIQAAVTRKPWRAGDPDNASTLLEALHGYTAGGAYAGHEDHRLGRLVPGLLADIVVMDRDLETEPADRLGQARAAITLCGGAVTWEG